MYKRQIKGLANIIRKKEWRIIVDDPFGIDSNPSNPAGLLIIEKIQILRVNDVQISFVALSRIQIYK